MPELVLRMLRAILGLLLRMFRVPVSRCIEFETMSQMLVERAVFHDGLDIRAIMDAMDDTRMVERTGDFKTHVDRTKPDQPVFEGELAGTKYYYARIIAFVRRLLGEGLGSAQVLDVGCSSGIFLELLGKSGTGVNVSAGAVANARRHGIDAAQASAEALPFETDSFDCVLCLNTLSHIENPVRAMREMARVSRDWVIVSLGESDCLTFLGYVEESFASYHWNVFRWTRQDLRRMAELLVRLETVEEDSVVVWGESGSVREALFKMYWACAERRYFLTAFRKKVRVDANGQ